MNDMFEGMFSSQTQKTVSKKEEKSGIVKIFINPPEQWSISDYIDYFIFKYKQKTGVETKNCGQFRTEVLVNIKNKIEMLGANNPWRYIKDYIDLFIEHDLSDIINTHIALEQVANAWRLMMSEVAWNKLKDKIRSALIIEKTNPNIENKYVIQESSVKKEIDILVGDHKLIPWRNILIQFGIPLAASYAKKYLNMSDKDIETSIDSIIKSSIFRAKKSIKNSDFIKMLMQTVARAPYPSEFLMVKWQNRYYQISCDSLGNIVIPYFEFEMTDENFSKDYHDFLSA